jgi:hypothetical protein
MPLFKNAKIEFIEIRSKSGKLVAKLDFSRGILHWKEGRDEDFIDLPAYYERVTGKKLDDADAD